MNLRHNKNYFFYKNLLNSLISIDSVGLEIGSLDRPLIEKKEGEVYYADFFDAEHNRERVLNIPGRDPKFVVEVDYLISKTPLNNIKKKFNYIVASHVIEHISDQVSWINTLSGLLSDNGILFLIVPDKRYTFDINRALTNVDDLLDCYYNKFEKPTFKQILQSRLYATPVDATKLWKGESPPKIPLRNIDDVYQDVIELSKKEYHDCHCHVFTNDSFKQVYSALFKTQFIDFKSLAVTDTNIGYIDFSAIFYKK